jgi:hypothetical protein
MGRPSSLGPSIGTFDPVSIPSALSANRCLSAVSLATAFGGPGAAGFPSSAFARAFRWAAVLGVLWPRCRDGGSCSAMADRECAMKGLRKKLGP